MPPAAEPLSRAFFPLSFALPADVRDSVAEQHVQTGDDDDSLRRTFAERAGDLPSVLNDKDRAELARTLSSADTAQGHTALCRWGDCGLSYLVVAAGLCWLMDALYFGFPDSGAAACDASLETRSQAELEYLVGWAPAYLRGALLLFVAKKICEKITGFEERGLGMALLAGHGDGGANAAGWLSLVQPADGKPQPTWATAREARGLSQRQAVSSATAKLFLWHLSQPLAYLGLLYVYRCFVAQLGGPQQTLASVVAAREVLYIVSLLFATAKLPVFLLLDLRTVWAESAPLERFVRLAMYVLTRTTTSLCAPRRGSRPGVARSSGLRQIRSSRISRPASPWRRCWRAPSKKNRTRRQLVRWRSVSRSQRSGSCCSSVRFRSRRISRRRLAGCSTARSGSGGALRVCRCCSHGVTSSSSSCC